MSEQLFRDLASAIQGGDPERIAEILHDLRRTGPAQSPERVALVEPLLRHSDGYVRRVAISVLCSVWRVPRLRPVAHDLWRHDPDEEIRSAALVGWTAYDEAVGDPAVGDALLQVMLDRDEPRSLRTTAYNCMFSVCRVPAAQRPSVHRVVADPDRLIDWALVWRLLAGLGVDLSGYRPPDGAG